MNLAECKHPKLCRYPIGPPICTVCGYRAKPRYLAFRYAKALDQIAALAFGEDLEIHDEAIYRAATTALVEMST